MTSPLPGKSQHNSLPQKWEEPLTSWQLTAKFILLHVERSELKYVLKHSSDAITWLHNFHISFSKNSPPLVEKSFSNWSIVYRAEVTSPLPGNRNHPSLFQNREELLTSWQLPANHIHFHTGHRWTCRPSSTPEMLHQDWTTFASAS